MTDRGIRELIAEMLDNRTHNGFPWAHLSAEELAADMCDNDDRLDNWDRSQVEYWIGDHLAHEEAKEGSPYI